MKALRILSLVVPMLFAGSSISAHAQSFKVGAYYFGVFNPQNAQTYLGGSDQWRGVRQLAQTSSYAHLKPALGYYDNADPLLLEKQIRQAKAAGLSYFNFYWYWNSSLNGSNGGEDIEEGLTAFLNAKNSDDLDFAISITAHPWQSLGIPESQYATVISTLVTKYISRSNYLKTSKGRPIIYVLDSQAIGVTGADGRKGSAADAQKFIAQLRAEVKNRTQLDPFIVINTELDYLQPTSFAGVDGYSCGSVYGLSLQNWQTDSVGTMTKYTQGLIPYLKNFNNRPMIPCSMVDFNETARYYFGLPPGSALRYLKDWKLADLQQNLIQVKNFSNALPASEVSKYINLYAWNEWHEGGVNIEPSETNGDRQLAMISATFGLPTQGDAACKKFGNCTHNNAHPSGTLDLANCNVIAGWSRDTDTAAPTKIHVYKGGLYGAGGVFVGEYQANLVRSDLPFRDKAHGFVIPTPAAFKTGAATSVYVYGIDTNANGDVATVNASHSVLNLSGRSLQCAP